MMKNKLLYPWMVFSVTSLGNLMIGLNMSSLNVALPEVTSYFNAGAVTAGWILLAFMLVNTIMILVFGRIADIYGRRNLFIFGLGLFSAASLLLGFSPNIWVLIVLRVLQAVGSALIISNLTPLITDAFPEKSLGTALGLNMLIAASGQLVGPAVGGYLAFSFGWQWVFWFNVPIGIIGMIWGFITLKPARGQAGEEKVDPIGNITMFMGLAGLILALSEGGVLGWLSTPVIAAWAVFLVFLLIFVWVERRVAYPVVDLTLFYNRGFAMAILAVFLSAIVRYSVVLLLALYFQVVESDNTMMAGLQVLYLAVGMLIASPISGWLSSKYSARRLTTSGLLLTCVGMLILMRNIGADNSSSWLIAGQFIAGFGQGIFMTPNTKSIMMTVPKNRRGVANGMRSMMLNMGQLVSTALSLMIVTGGLPPRLKDALYAGAGANLADNDVMLIVNGYRMAFFVMLILTVLAVAASYLRTAPAKLGQSDNE